MEEVKKETSIYRKERMLGLNMSEEMELINLWKR